MNIQRPVWRLRTGLYNTPHLIEPASFREVISYLEMRNSGVMAAVEVPYVTPDKAEKVCEIGLIKIHGTLTNKPVQAMCEEVGTSYESLLEQVEELLEMGCKTIVFDICSGGGEGFNCFATGREIRRMADEAGCHLISYVQNMAASAAYALCVASDEVISHPQGRVGSIGVLIELYNDNKRMQMQGYSRTFVTAGENKIPYDADGEFKPEFIAELQASVDETYEEFCSYVSEFTGISVEAVMATQASVYGAKKALEMGMINSIMTNEEFANYLKNKQGMN